MGVSALVVGAIGTTASAGMSYVSARQQSEAARQAEAMGVMNAMQQRRETEEAVRRTKLEQAKVLGMTKARIAASGVTPGGSMGEYVSEMKKTHAKDIKWMRKSGASQERAEILRGRYDAQTARAASTASIGQAFSSLGAAGGAWWEVSQIR